MKLTFRTATSFCPTDLQYDDSGLKNGERLAEIDSFRTRSLR
ncbi:hypothetical protein [Phormidesmis priestleyi]|nr:hypothetical protein [Phormidesmis priestleyi]